MDNSTYRPQPVSFVRRGSRLQGRREKAWDENREQYLIDVPRALADTSVDPGYRFDAVAAFGREAELVLEIGSGLGEAVVHAAAAAPERDFLAVEVYLPGLAQTVQRAAAHGLANIRVVQANAPEVLATMIPEGSLTEVWTFFSDPWPKSKHEKRRLVTAEFAELVAKSLKPGGVWRLATDWEHYAEQMLEIGEASSLVNDYETWAPRYEGRIITSFENKAHLAGRTVRDLSYRKQD